MSVRSAINYPDFGPGGSQNLDQVLTVGNNAGGNSISNIGDVECVSLECSNILTANNLASVNILNSGTISTNNLAVTGSLNLLNLVVDNTITTTDLNASDAITASSVSASGVIQSSYNKQVLGQYNEIYGLPFIMNQGYQKITGTIPPTSAVTITFILAIPLRNNQSVNPIVSISWAPGTGLLAVNVTSVENSLTVVGGNVTQLNVRVQNQSGTPIAGNSLFINWVLFGNAL